MPKNAPHHASIAAAKPRERLLTVAEIGEHLRLSSSAAYRAVGEMRQFKVGARILVPESALDEYLAARIKEPAPPTARRRRGSSARAALATKAPALDVETLRRPIRPRTKPKP